MKWNELAASNLNAHAVSLAGCSVRHRLTELARETREDFQLVLTRCVIEDRIRWVLETE
jgi:hypothetical protein